MSDFERVKKAMQMVWNHRLSLPVTYLTSHEWDALAETAVKTMWLIEEKSRTQPSVQPTEDTK